MTLLGAFSWSRWTREMRCGPSGCVDSERFPGRDQGGKAGMEAIITVLHGRRQLSFLDGLLLGPVPSAEAAWGHTGEKKAGKWQPVAHLW